MHNIQIDRHYFLIGKVRLIIITEAFTNDLKSGIIYITDIQIDSYKFKFFYLILVTLAYIKTFLKFEQDHEQYYK